MTTTSSRHLGCGVCAKVADKADPCTKESVAEGTWDVRGWNRVEMWNSHCFFFSVASAPCL